jgi:hypothetical protein
MRTFNGLQIFTQQLTNSGQLDLRYVRITGNDQSANIYLNNLTQDYDFFVNTNFNITKSMNIFYSDDANTYTGYMPDITDKKIITIKNLTNISGPLILSGYAEDQKFDLASELLSVGSLNGGDFLGVKNQYYTGWISITKTNGVS